MEVRSIVHTRAPEFRSIIVSFTEEDVEAMKTKDGIFILGKELEVEGVDLYILGPVAEVDMGQVLADLFMATDDEMRSRLEALREREQGS